MADLHGTFLYRWSPVQYLACLAQHRHCSRPDRIVPAVSMFRALTVVLLSYYRNQLGSDRERDKTPFISPKDKSTAEPRAVLALD